MTAAGRDDMDNMDNRLQDDGSVQVSRTGLVVERQKEQEKGE